MYSNLIYVCACTIRWLFCSILSRYRLRGLFGDSWTKTLQYFVSQIQTSFICLIGIFSDRETLEILTVFLSFEDLLPRLTFTCFCFICGTVPLVFICDYGNVVDSLNHVFFLLGECHPLFPCLDCHKYLQFSSETVPLNIVWLSHNALSLTMNLLVSFYFICYSYFAWTATPFCLFLWVELSHFS